MAAVGEFYCNIVFVCLCVVCYVCCTCCVRCVMCAVCFALNNTFVFLCVHGACVCVFVCVGVCVRTEYVRKRV